jgi:hypothetical protein
MKASCQEQTAFSPREESSPEKGNAALVTRHPESQLISNLDGAKSTLASPSPSIGRRVAMPRYEFVLNETACCGAPIVIEYRDGNLYPTAAVIESKLTAGRPTQMVHPCAVSAIMHVSSAYILAGESSRGVVKKEVEPLQREGSDLNAKPREIKAFRRGQLAPGRTQELQTELLAVGIAL